jgi:hypothetical protein
VASRKQLNQTYKKGNATHDDTANHYPKLLQQYIQELGLDEFHDEFLRSPDGRRLLDERPLNEWLETFYRRKIIACENSWREGNILALAVAVGLCDTYGTPLPPWCEAGVQKIIAESYFKGRSGTRGRHSRQRTKHDQDQIHFVRWCKVCELRERPQELKRTGVKPTWEATFEKASLDLRGTGARGEPGAIKDSYRRVQSAMRAGKAAKYYLA